jgi:hypothetical protein
MNCTFCKIPLVGLGTSTTNLEIHKRFGWHAGRFCDVCSAMYHAVGEQRGLCDAQEAWVRQRDSLAKLKRQLMAGNEPGAQL